MNKLLKQAFTLIELLVVIAIIGILSGLIIVSMGGVTSKASVAKAQVFSNSLRNSLLLNLVSEWRLDENTGSATIDSWSGGNTGTLTGVTHLPVWKTGSDCVNGSCLQFDGTEDLVDFGTNSNLSMGLGDATISFWVRFDSDIAPQSETLVYSGGSSTVAGCPGYWLVRYNGTSRLYIYFSDGTVGRISGYLSPAGSLVSNIYYNVVVVITRTSTAQAYINGAKQAISYNISAQPGDVQNCASYKIGATPSYRLLGKMDEFRVYNAAMSTSQIEKQYYIGLNKLLVGGGITGEEYLQRIGEIANY